MKKRLIVLFLLLALVLSACTLTDPAAPTEAPVIVYPQPQGELPWLAVNFPALLQRNSDVVGWLYGQDGQINLPIVQGRDNSYYLHRMLDGTWNYAGTLFVDYRNNFLRIKH